MTPASIATAYVRALVDKGVPLNVAARRFVREQPETALRLMEDVGCWPSSEPEIAAVQRAWP